MNLFPTELTQRTAHMLELAQKNNIMLATVESCTGGLLAGLITEISGSARVFERGFVTYSDRAKTSLVGVPPELIEAHGAVSEPVARAMAEGGLSKAGVQLAVAITGVAGPTGGSPAKPVGLVHFAAAAENAETLHEKRNFGSIGRSAIRLASLEVALDLFERQLAGFSK